MIPKRIFDQILDKSTEGLALASAPDEDGAMVVIKWCNKAFTTITGYDATEVVGQRASILVGPNMSQGNHLFILEKLVNWERFSIKVLNNRKNGEQYWHQMTWVPISDIDPNTDHRWWLYSLIELPGIVKGSAQTHPQSKTLTIQGVTAEHDAKVQRLEHEIEHLQKRATAVTKEAHEDTLTGLSNRRHFEIQFKSWVSDFGKGRAGFAVLYIDIDRFKSVNDTLGHDAGDRLLISIAEVLCTITTETDLVARIGGDEFIILRRLGDSALNISDLADHIIAEIKNIDVFKGQSPPINASIGVAIADATSSQPEQVVADADMALSHVKSNGSGRWSFFTEEMHTDLMLTRQLETDILRACKRREFTAFFQPLIEAQSGRIASAEALVRWVHPTRGLLSPASFLDTAKDIGVLRKIDEIVFECVCESLTYFDECNVWLPRVAVNISAERLNYPNLIHEVKNSDIDPDRLIFEILESVSIEKKNEPLSGKLRELSEMGVTIAIDDFGTGHASIQGLLQIKPSILKIAPEFIKNIVTDQVSRTMVSSIVAIGKSLNLSIVAEGVETEEHAQLATAMECDYLQGYCFGKPMRASDFRSTLIDTRGQYSSPRALHRSE